MLVEAITTLNHPRSGNGLPNPYYGSQRCVAALCETTANPMRRDSPLGSSYALGALVEFLVRRLRKQAMKSLWEGITFIHLSEMEYAMPQDFYLWRTYEGQLRQRYVERPQAWDKLVAQARADSDKGLPMTLHSRPDFALMFMLVYPHRFNRGLLRLVEAGADA